jgi:hypothetical protein
MNEDRVIEVLAQIEWNIKAFQAKAPGAVGFNMAFWFSERQYQDSVRDETNVCGTVACLAGHAIVHEGLYTLMGGSDYAYRSVKDDQGRTREEGVDVQAHAAEYLGISLMQSETLFYYDNLDQVYRWFANEMGVDEQVLRDKVAAA